MVVVCDAGLDARGDFCCLRSVVFQSILLQVAVPNIQHRHLPPTNISTISAPQQHANAMVELLKSFSLATTVRKTVEV